MSKTGGGFTPPTQDTEKCNTIIDEKKCSPEEKCDPEKDSPCTSEKKCNPTIEAIKIDLVQQDTVDETPSADEEVAKMPEVTMPKAWQEMKASIRQAVRSIRAPVTQASIDLLADTCTAGLRTPPTDYYLAITDEIRELSEVKLDRGDLTANKAEVSFNQLCAAVRKYNVEHSATPIDLAAILYRTNIVKKDDHAPEVLLERLQPCERLRLRGSERRYQKMVSGSVPVSREGDTVSSLAVETKGSVALALSLLTGLILSFVTGWLGGPFLGAKSEWARAVLGLVLAVLFLTVEVGLILVRYAKLDRVKNLRARRRERRLKTSYQ